MAVEIPEKNAGYGPSEKVPKSNRENALADTKTAGGAGPKA